VLPPDLIVILLQQHCQTLQVTFDAQSLIQLLSEQPLKLQHARLRHSKSLPLPLKVFLPQSALLFQPPLFIAAGVELPLHLSQTREQHSNLLPLPLPPLLHFVLLELESLSKLQRIKSRTLQVALRDLEILKRAHQIVISCAACLLRLVAVKQERVGS